MHYITHQKGSPTTLEHNLIKKIEEFESLDINTILSTIDEVIELLNLGNARAAEKVNESWVVNTWVKQAILLGFRYRKTEKQTLGGFDKFGLLEHKNPKYRKVPGAIIREGVYIGSGAIIMPSYINIGAYVDENTLIDINAAVGSCAQIGKNCHISALTCIGGVLEPVAARPVIIENNCFIGAHCSILEGIIVEENCVIASGVTITSSTKIIDQKTGNIYHGRVPANSVVVPGSYQKDNLNISCAIIIKSVDSKTMQKTGINEILRTKHIESFFS
jgi:2,3,4,5-tetrahydropyridine-2-carboxylate N-succinyltransferase